MIKRFSILSALMVLATMGLASSAQAKPAIGIADQTVETLNDPRFKKSGTEAVSDRGVVRPDPQGRQAAEAPGRVLPVGQGAAAGRDRVLLPDLCDQNPKRAARLLPTVAQFRKDFRAFRKRYPQIKKFSTWNEINFKIAQPTGRNPKRAGQFYKMLRKECRGGKCSVLTGDFRPDGSKADVRWQKVFLKEIGGARTSGA